MKIEFISPSNIKDVKLNCLILWTDEGLKLFDKEVHGLIKNEDEFLYRQFRDKKTLSNNNILFCAGIENKIDSYVLSNIYYEGNNITTLENTLKSINKLTKYIDIININSIGVLKPKMKISDNSIRNNTLLFTSILKSFKENDKLKKIYFITEDIQDIKLIKKINFLLKIPFIKRFV